MAIEPMRAANKTQTRKERCRVVFNNGCIHGMHHSELLVARRKPDRSVVQDSIAVFTVSRTFACLAALTVFVMLMLLLTGCFVARPQKGGMATTMINCPGHTNAVTFGQSDNPKEPSLQTVQSEESLEYVLPAGTMIPLSARRAHSIA